MFTFACKVIREEDVVRCTLNLNKTEYNLLRFFFRNSGTYTTNEISSKLKLERTTVQKALKTLMKKKIVTRKKAILEGGGYVYFYELSNKDVIKKKIKQTILKWSKDAIKKIENM